MSTASIDSPNLTLCERDALVLGHLRLVGYVAGRWFRPWLFTALGPDLLAEGRLALVDAAARFDPSRAVLFSTWAVRWMRHRMADLARVHRPILRGPDWPGFDAEAVADAVARLPEPDRSVISERLAGATLEEVGARRGFTRERARQIEARAKALLADDAALAAYARGV